MFVKLIKFAKYILQNTVRLKKCLNINTYFWQIYNSIISKVSLNFHLNIFYMLN